MNTTKPSILRGVQRAQRGVSLLFALMALVLMTLGAVALLRSVDTGLLVLGNLGFKQDALAASSVGTEAAITWLQANGGVTLEQNQAAQGYSAVAAVGLDPTGRSVAGNSANLVLIDWQGNGCNVPGLNGRVPVCVVASAPIAAPGNNRVRYVITRLCAQVGPAGAANDCLAPAVIPANAATGTTQRGSISYGGGSSRWGPQSLDTYYRILTRTEGVRGTVSYTETLVHF